MGTCSDSIHSGCNSQLQHCSWEPEIHPAIQKDSMLSCSERPLLLLTGHTSYGVVTTEGWILGCDSVRCPCETPENRSKRSTRTVLKLSQQPQLTTWAAPEVDAFNFRPEWGWMEATEISNKHLPFSIVSFGQKVSFVHVKHTKLFSATYFCSTPLVTIGFQWITVHSQG